MVDPAARRNHIEILIVEDSPTQAEQLKFILEKNGFTASVASNGEEALAVLKTRKPDIVITDILMPKMDGYELCRQIRKNWNFTEMPVILVTALSAPVDVIKGLEVGANNFITKPYDEEHLISRVQYLIANRDLRKDSRAEMDGNVIFSGQNYRITADRLQILDLLLSSYENAYRQNRELLRVQKELTELNERLEETVQERDAEIAERRLAEEALIRAKEEWERTFASVPDLIAILDHQHRVLRVNAAMARRLGVKPEEAVGLRCYEVVHGLSEPPDYCPHSRTMKDGRQHVQEMREDRLGGDFVVSTTPLYDDRKKMIGTVHVAHDVTERKRAEEAVRSARDDLEQRVRERTADLARQAELLNLTHDAIFVWDMEGRMTFWNRGAEEMYGWTRDEALGQVGHMLLRTGLPESQEAAVSELLAKGRWEGEIVHTRRDGSHVVVASRWAVQRDEHGAATGVLELNTDITEHKRIDEERQRLAAAVENTGEAVLITDSRFVIRYVNPAFTRSTGYACEEVVGRDANLLSSNTDFSERIEKTAESSHPWVDVYQFRHKNGAFFPASTSISSIKDSSGAITYYVVVAHDITEQQKLEGQLRQAQKMEALGILTGGIAHDFNNILAAVIGFTELAKDNLPEGGRDEHHLQRVLQAGLRGRDLIKQMLTFSRKTEQERKALRLSSVIRETVKLLRASIPTTVSINVDVRSEPGLIIGDPVQIEQVLMNLCTNAAYAMRERGGVLDVELFDFSVSTSGRSDGMKPGPYMKLVVRDTGVGIPPDIIDKIFDPFFTTKKLGEGTGLGLSVVHGIVRQHDGYITAESEPGKGSTFSVYFPKVAEERPREAVSNEAVPAGHERVLLIDDEVALMEIGERLLEKLGYKVTAKNSSVEALALFTADPSRFDVVVTDQTMPEITGLELARACIALRPDIPIILATGFSHTVDADAAQTAGIRAFVMKPLTKGELARTVRKVLDG